MKIKDALITCINGMDNNESLYGAFAFTHFVENLAIIQVHTAARLLTRNMSKMRIGKKDAGGGEGLPYDAVTVTDILRVIKGGDLPRHISLYNQSLDFFKWYLNEAVPEDLLSVDGSPLSWYDLEFLGRKWNEFVQIATEEE